MKEMMIKMIVVFIVFFIGTGCLLFLDNLCLETTGSGGNLVLNIEK